MTCIKILTDNDFGLENLPMDNFKERLGARGILFNNKNEIAIINKQNKNEFKLVGGGLEDYEAPENAFKREVLEETGCDIKIDILLGTIVENKSHDNFKQTSYVYVAHVINDIGIIKYTEEEQKNGARLIWLPMEIAKKVIKESENRLIKSKYDGEMSIYHTKFIVRRDYEILNYYSNKYCKKGN